MAKRKAKTKKIKLKAKDLLTLEPEVLEEIFLRGMRAVLKKEQWHLDMTINHSKGEEHFETTHDTSDNLITHLGLILKEQTGATSFVVTIVPGKGKDNG